MTFSCRRVISATAPGFPLAGECSVFAMVNACCTQIPGLLSKIINTDNAQWFIMPSLFHCDDYSVLYSTFDDALSCNCPLSVSMSSDLSSHWSDSASAPGLSLLSLYFYSSTHMNLACPCSLSIVAPISSNNIQLPQDQPIHAPDYPIQRKTTSNHSFTFHVTITHFALFIFSCNKLLISLYSLFMWQITHFTLFTFHVTNSSFHFNHFSCDN